MRIDSTDAATRTTVNLLPLEAKTELPVQEKSTNGDSEAVLEKVSTAFINKALDKANETMKASGRSLEFTVYERTNDIIVKVIDTETKEVIREIPPEKMLDMFANMLELAGLIIDERR